MLLQSLYSWRNLYSRDATVLSASLMRLLWRSVLNRHSQKDGIVLTCCPPLADVASELHWSALREMCRKTTALFTHANPNSPSQHMWEEYRQAGSEMQILLVEWCECSHALQRYYCFLFCFFNLCSGKDTTWRLMIKIHLNVEKMRKSLCSALNLNVKATFCFHSGQISVHWMHTFGSHKGLKHTEIFFFLTRCGHKLIYSSLVSQDLVVRKYLTCGSYCILKWMRQRKQMN